MLILLDLVSQNVRAIKQVQQFFDKEFVRVIDFIFVNSESASIVAPQSMRYAQSSRRLPEAKRMPNG